MGIDDFQSTGCYANNERSVKNKTKCFIISSYYAPNTTHCQINELFRLKQRHDKRFSKFGGSPNEWAFSKVTICSYNNHKEKEGGFGLKTIALCHSINEKVSIRAVRSILIVHAIGYEDNIKWLCSLFDADRSWHFIIIRHASTVISRDYVYNNTPSLHPTPNHDQSSNIHTSMPESSACQTLTIITHMKEYGKLHCEFPPWNAVICHISSRSHMQTKQWNRW